MSTEHSLHDDLCLIGAIDKCTCDAGSSDVSSYAKVSDNERTFKDCGGAECRTVDLDGNLLCDCIPPEQNLSDKSDTATETRRVTESRHEPGECNDPSRENATSSHAEASKPYLTPQRDSTRTSGNIPNREVIPPIPHDHVEHVKHVISEINPSNDIECAHDQGWYSKTYASRAELYTCRSCGHETRRKPERAVISRDEKVSESTQNPLVITESVINDDSYKRIGELDFQDTYYARCTSCQSVYPFLIGIQPTPAMPHGVNGDCTGQEWVSATLAEREEYRRGKSA